MAKNDTNAALSSAPVAPAIAPSAYPDNIEFDAIAAMESETFHYDIPSGDVLDKLAILRTIKADIAAENAENAGTMQEAQARKARLERRFDAAVLAVSELLSSVPAKLVQARLHMEYGGKVDSNGKASKTIPAGDGEAFLKAGKAYRDVSLYVETGKIPESWTRGAGTRAEIAELLDESDRQELWLEVTGKSKIAVSDTVTRFFRDLTPKARPLWMNPEKLNDMAETLYLNEEYIRDDKELRLAYETLFAAFKAVTAER